MTNAVDVDLTPGGFGLPGWGRQRSIPPRYLGISVTAAITIGAEPLRSALRRNVEKEAAIGDYPASGGFPCRPG
jgi:hypothetical protein